MRGVRWRPSVVRTAGPPRTTRQARHECHSPPGGIISYETANQAKASFDDAYTAPTTRAWLNCAPQACNVRTVGLDSSAPAIRFAVDAGLLDGGIARDFEEPGVEPTGEELSWFRSCNLLISTGAIGYVTRRTLEPVLRSLGEDHPGKVGPFAVVTILRMFESGGIEDVFETHGFRFGPVPGVRLPQRRFIDDQERREVLSVLAARGIDTAGWEDRGRQFADLFVAARPARFDGLRERMRETHVALTRDEGIPSYIHR